MNEALEKYFIKNSFVPKSRKRILFCSNHYKQWIAGVNLNIEEVTYKDLLNYIGYLQESKSKVVVNQYLCSVSHYYRSLELPDIAHEVRLRGIEKEQPLLLTEEELNTIYNNYECPARKGYYRYSNKILLGFIIYQALDEKDILRLELGHLDLYKGTLAVPGGDKRKVSRILSLEGHQVLQLHHYIEDHRDKTTDKLFSPQAAVYENLNSQYKELSKQVRALAASLNYNVTRLHRLRQSRITIWVKQYGLRKAQYYGGFRNVYSVEQYRQHDTEDLQQAVLQFHPLK